MNRKQTHRTRAGLVALSLCAAMACAHGQASSPYLGGLIGDTDFGTGIRVFGGARITNIIGWEAQLTSFGSRTISPGGSISCSNSAWALGGGATATMPLTTSVSAFGKLGGHYLKTRVSGPCSDTGDGSLELGLGLGMLWQFSPKAALRVEFENIGGSNGDFIAVGLQFPL